VRFSGLVAFSSVSLVALSAPALAQEVAASSAGEEGLTTTEIVVSARRREESLQDVPLVVNAVTAESLERLNIREGTEVQNLVPGLQLRIEPSGISAAGQLRGVQYDINTSAGPTVAFYLNDAPMDAGPLMLSLYDIGQIEVLRGPQGTLRGTATPSGSITFTTRKPNLEQAGMNLQGTATDTGLYNLNGAINVPIVQGIFGVRAAGVVDDSNGNRVRSIDSDADLRRPFGQTYSGRVIATLEPTDWLKLEGMYQTTKREARQYDQYASFSLADPSAPASPVLIRPKDRRSIQETARTINQRYEIFNWRGELRYGGQALIYQGSRFKLNFDGTTNVDTANFIDGLDPLQTTHTNSRLTSHELRLQSEQRVLGIVDYVVGYYHTKQVAPTLVTIETPVLLPPLFGGGVATVQPTDILTKGVVTEESFFGNLTVHLDDATQVSGGLRHVHLKMPESFLTIGSNNIPTASAKNDKKLIYSASIQHNFTPDLMIYASTGTSRRYGPTIVNTSAIQRSSLMQSFIDLRPENSESYEIGIKSSWLDGRMVFNITGYYQKFKNYPYKISTPIYYQSSSFNGTTFEPSIDYGAQFGASVPVDVKGVEAELAWKVSPNFNFNILASYSDAKIKNGLIPCNDLNGDGVPDVITAAPTLADLQAAYGTDYIGSCRVSQRSSVQAPFSATVQAEYRQPISGKLDGFVRGLFNYYGSSQVEPINDFDNLDAYGLLNLYAGIRDSDGGWELNFYAKNVFDVIRTTSFLPPAATAYQELNSTFTSTVGKSYTGTYSIIQTTPPREFGVNLRIAIGSR
jgi:iron complex outermembrane receptor protein